MTLRDKVNELITRAEGIKKILSSSAAQPRPEEEKKRPPPPQVHAVPVRAAEEEEKKATPFELTRPTRKLDSVVGLEEAKSELKSVLLAFFQGPAPKPIPRILLYGVPLRNYLT